MNDITEHEARQQLARASAGGLGTRRDRLVHGWATAAFGTLVAVFLLLNKALDDRQPWHTLLAVGYTVLLVGLAFWQKRATRTVPRYANRIGILGVVGSVLLGIVALGIVSFWDAPWVYVVCAVGVALPALAAGAAIARR